MEELNAQYNIAKLISKEIVEGISNEEKETLRQWIEASEENAKLYEKIKKGEQSNVRDKYVKSLDVKSAWQKVSIEITPKQKLIRLKEWSLRVAAVLAIGILIGTVYHISTIAFGDAAKLADVQIDPGSSKAILLLHGGETVQLENASNNSITEADGTLLNCKDGRLEYLAQDNAAEQTLYNTIMVPIGGEYQLTLADGTKVWLNSDSHIKYPVQFNQQKRKVWIAGEVYFDVAHDKSKPFIVDVKDVEVEVLGTQFNVEAYHDQNSVVTTLVEGSVKLSKEQESVIITPNQQAVISENERQFAVNKVDARNYALWKDGIFYFEQASLSTIMEKLERWYNIKVLYKNQSLADKRFSIEVKRYKNIDDVLNMLSRTEKVHFDIKANVVTVTN